MPLPDFEKLGSFYLGREYDVDARRRSDSLILYDSKDLVTHAVCVGMTGSGKTGLCIDLLEEAAIDAIPSIVIDPKGDLANLLLTFPDLKPEDFRPWINEEDARKKGVTPDQLAAEQAERWRNGLTEWGQDADRIRRLKDAADFALYTPGSNAGLPVSVLRSFDAPPSALLDDPELFGERVSGTATSLLALLGIEADPLRSREHILLSTILSDAWTKGQSLDIPALIRLIQHPAVTRVGVMELETFYPAQDRFSLAMALNNLVASPGFSRWTEGEPLDIGAMLFTAQGKPRVSVFSIAHLNDDERMFFVSMLLNQTLAWVRQQSGTSSLRAILYMDEIAGYFPPTANPPSKQPLLTLMKQARAFGVGVVLATQNPVDLDYKGLANAGTWFIGRLQTERDKARVLDGLEGAMATASAAFDRSRVDDLLSQLSSRVFLMNNIHEDAPVIFETRWALSYLRGPMTRNQLRLLSDMRRAASPAMSPTSLPPSTPAAPPPLAIHPAPASAPAPAGPAAFDESTDSSADPDRPVLPPEIHQYFIPARSGSSSSAVTYVPMVLGCARVYYADAKSGVDTQVSVSLLAPIQPGPVPIDWAHADEVTFSDADVLHAPAPGAAFAPLPTAAARPKSYEAWKKSLAETLYRSHKLELFRSGTLDLCSTPGESERDFRARLQQTAREERDARVDKLRQKYAPKLATLQDRARRAQQAIDVQREQAKSAKLNSALSIGSAILSAFTGRKVASAGNVSRAATAARGAGRAAKESSDIERAQENFDAVQRQLQALDAEFQEEAREIMARLDVAGEDLETIAIKPKKTNIAVRTVMLAWAPHTAGPDRAPAW
jgi:hypothetical protein